MVTLLNRMVFGPAQRAVSVAALGVIASLIFVGIQVRRNTLETRITNFQALAQNAIGWAENISANQQIAEIYDKGLANYEQLTQTDRTRFNMIMMSILVMIEMSNFQLSHGVGEVTGGNPPDKVLRRFTSQPGFVTWWQNDRRIDLGDETIAYIDNLIAS